MPNNADPEATIAQYADDATVVDELHAVPPYRVYEIRLDGRRAVLKVDAHPRGHAASEGSVQSYVADRTTAPVPEVLIIGDDHFVAEWDEGIAQGTGELTTDWARAAGAWLGRLHADTTDNFDGYGRPFVDAGDVSDDGSLAAVTHDEWADAARARIDYHRPFLQDIGYADVTDAVDDLLADHPSVFEGAGTPVLCHGNVHPEHVATEGNKATATIDFEHALIAPAEYDYWRVVTPLFEIRDNGSEALTDAFREGYERVRSLPNDLQHRRSEYELVNLVAYIESLHLQQNIEPTERERIGGRFRKRVFDEIERVRANLG